VILTLDVTKQELDTMMSALDHYATVQGEYAIELVKNPQEGEDPVGYETISILAERLANVLSYSIVQQRPDAEWEAQRNIERMTQTLATSRVKEN
jgi:hypothetical protein